MLPADLPDTLWGEDNRSARERIAVYDRDGLIAANYAELGASIEGFVEEMAEAFWQHFIDLPHMRPHRHVFTPDYLQKRIARTTHYTRVKFANPFDDEWCLIAAR